MSQPLRITTRASDRVKRKQLRRMKSVATGLLLLSAVVYLLAKRAEAEGAAEWVSYVRAAAEAGMIGGLADWFAVTALFRRPLGLPIPHTAIIPTRLLYLSQALVTTLEVAYQSSLLRAPDHFLTNLELPWPTCRRSAYVRHFQRP